MMPFGHVPPRQTLRMTGSAGRPLLIDGSTAPLAAVL